MSDNFEIEGFIDQDYLNENQITVYEHKLSFLEDLTEDGAVTLQKNELNRKVILKKFYSQSKMDREIQRYISLKHEKNVANFLGVGKDLRSIILEYYPNKTLSEYVKNNKIESKEFDRLFKEILDILKVLERYDITHYDLKPSNILLNEKNKLIVCDFDTSREEIYHYVNTTSKLGTLHYTAPEVLSNTPIKKSNLADIFSMGKVIYYMFTKQESIDFNSYELIFDKKIPFPYNIIIDKMIKHSPYDRYKSSSEIETEYLTIRNYIKSDKLEQYCEEIIQDYSNKNLSKFGNNEDFMHNLFYYTIISKKFNFKFLSYIFFENKEFNFEMLKEFNKFDRKLFKNLINTIIDSINTFTKKFNYDFEISEFVYINFKMLLSISEDNELKESILEFLCYITLNSNRFELMDEINRDLVSNTTSPEIRVMLLYLVSKFKYKHNIGFLNDIKNKKFCEFKFQDYFEKFGIDKKDYPTHFRPKFPREF